jgi:hypothetical protein
MPVQAGAVPVADAQLRHWPADRAALDQEIGYWVQQSRPPKWIMPERMDKLIAGSPTLDIDLRNLAVSVFSRGQVKNIGDPLFGDLARLAAVLSGQIALLPVAAEFVGADSASATLNIATAVLNATDGAVIWFGVIPGSEKGALSQAALASGAQAFAQAFAPRKN